MQSLYTTMCFPRISLIEVLVKFIISKLLNKQHKFSTHVTCQGVIIAR